MNTNEELKTRPENPDKEHFDGMLLKELAWKLDREVWAHVQNTEPSEEWSTSKAREETRRLIKEYIGDYDKIRTTHVEPLQAENARLKNDLLDALDLKAGNGPTALSMLHSENQKLREIIESAFIAGRSKTSWEQFQKDNGLLKP